MSGARFTEGMDFQADWDASPRCWWVRAYMEYATMSTGTRPPAGIMVFPASFWITTLIIELRHVKAAARRQKHQRQRDVRREHGHGDCEGDWRASYDHRDDDENAPHSDQAWAATTPIAHYRRSGPGLRWAKAISSPMFSTAFSFISVPASFLTVNTAAETARLCAEVVGIARSNARDQSLSRRGRVLYETQVPAGPFRIQDLNQSVSGTLRHRGRAERSDRRFDVNNTASVPFTKRAPRHGALNGAGPPRRTGIMPHYRHIRLGGSFVGVTNGADKAAIWRHNWRKQLSAGPWRWEAVRMAWWARWRSTGVHASSPTCKTTGLTAKLCRVTHIA